MRIFNWVQRRLNPNNFRDIRLGRSSVKKDECVGNGFESESWKDGILTIGTFGYDPLKHFPQHDHLFPEVWTQEEEDVDYDDDEEEEDDYNNNNNNNVDSGKLDDDEEEELNPLIFSKPSDDDELEYEEYPISTSMRKNDDSSPADTYDEITKRRTTLADLFVAESSSSDYKLTVHVLSNHIDDVAGEKNKKKKKKETRSSPNQQSSGGLQDKFKVEDDHENPRPVKIKKLHRLMKKILKKKIYPEDVNGAPVINQKKHVQATAHHESLCLLHTGGAAADAMP